MVHTATTSWGLRLWRWAHLLVMHASGGSSAEEHNGRKLMKTTTPRECKIAVALHVADQLVKSKIFAKEKMAFLPLYLTMAFKEQGL